MIEGVKCQRRIYPRFMERRVVGDKNKERDEADYTARALIGIKLDEVAYCVMKKIWYNLFRTGRRERRNMQHNTPYAASPCLSLSWLSETPILR